MNNEIIKLNNVTKVYKLYKDNKKRLLSIFVKDVKYIKKHAIKNVSLKIKRGEAVAVLGKNGAGKSTLLKLISEVAFPTEGQVEVRGKVNALLELSVGFIPELTGRENIYLKGQIQGMTDKEIKEIEENIISFAELEEYIDQPIRTYSSGMKARLGFSIFVNMKSEILIIDEALSVGDQEFKEKCINKIKGLIKEENKTLLFVTHNKKMAQRICDRGIILDRGELLFDGNLQNAIQVYNNNVKKGE